MDEDLIRRPLRIAAGGFLSLTSIFNAFLALGFWVGGAYAVNLGAMAGVGGDAFNTRNPGLVEAFGGPVVLGQIFIISAGAVFVGAVSVFSSRYPRAIYVACAIAIFSALLAVGVGNFGLSNAVGIVAGGMGCISGLRIQLYQANAASTGRPQSFVDWVWVGILLFGLLMLVVSTYLLFN